MPGGLFVAPAQGPAHHAGGADTEQVIDCIEGQQHRRGQSNRRILHRIVQHAHKVGIRQIVQHHYQ